LAASWCIAVNSWPGATPAVTRAASTASPRRERSRTRSPFATPSRAASSGWISTHGSAACSFASTGERRVRVSVCHCADDPRPVFSTNGNSSSVGSGSGRGGSKQKRARPSGWWNTPSSNSRRSEDSSCAPSPSGHCTPPASSSIR
jgi:hypothetical protein